MGYAWLETAYSLWSLRSKWYWSGNILAGRAIHSLAVRIRNDEPNRLGRLCFVLFHIYFSLGSVGRVQHYWMFPSGISQQQPLSLGLCPVDGIRLAPNRVYFYNEGTPFPNHSEITGVIFLFHLLPIFMYWNWYPRDSITLFHTKYRLSCILEHVHITYPNLV